MSSYYNENDPFAAAWLRKLIAAGMIAAGDVDERSIADVKMEDLNGYTQCHFFAGIGVWSYALRCAGWPDERPVWTGSCPCPSFSCAGKGCGFSDPRHLWPDWFRIIRECRSPVIFGEQVKNAIGHGWLDLVFTDLESQDYACGSAVLPACGVGAPHQRDRLYWVADSNRKWRESDKRRVRRAETATENSARGYTEQLLGRGSPTDILGNTELYGQSAINESRTAKEKGRLLQSERPSSTDILGNANSVQHKSNTRSARKEKSETGGVGNDATRLNVGCGGSISAVKGFWRDAEWLYCTDGKYRPVEPAPLGLVDGLAADLGRVRIADREVFFPLIQKGKNRVGRLRGYGNALVAPQAEAFIRAYMEIQNDCGCEEVQP